MTGFIKLSRSFFNNKMWQAARKFSECEAWLDLIQSARFEASPITSLIGSCEVTWSRGQYPASVRFLSKKWGQSESWVRRCLSKFKKEGMITIENTQGVSVITLVNFDKYNGIGDNITDTPKDTQCDTPNNLSIKQLEELMTQVATQAVTQEVKRVLKERHTSDTNNKKEERNYIEKPSKEGKKRDFDFSFVDDSFKEPFNTWLDYKKARKESYKTQESLEACYNKLFKLSGGSFITANEIINQSMANNWAGLFELKKENNNGKRADTQARRESVRNLKDLSAAVLERIASNED